MRSEVAPDAFYGPNEKYVAVLPLDEARWAWSFAGKNPEPFVM